MSAADRPLRCMVLIWLFFVLVLVLDRSDNCIIPSWSTRCSGGDLVTDRLMEIRSMIRELGNGGLWAVTEAALMPCTRSVRLRLRALSASLIPYQIPRAPNSLTLFSQDLRNASVDMRIGPIAVIRTLLIPTNCMVRFFMAL